MENNFIESVLIPTTVFNKNLQINTEIIIFEHNEKSKEFENPKKYIIENINKNRTTITVANGLSVENENFERFHVFATDIEHGWLKIENV